MGRRILAGLAIGVILLVVAAASLLGRSEQPFYDYLAERRAAGLPTTWEEFVGPAPPDSENAYVDLAAAWDKLVADHGRWTEWEGSRWNTSSDDQRPWPECLDDAGRAALAATEERLRPGLIALPHACEKPRFVAPENFAVDGWMCWGDERLLDALVDAMEISAAADPDPARRLAACRAILMLAARSETCIAGTKARAGAITVLRYGVEAGRIDAAAARAACDEWLRVPATDRLRRQLRAEAVKLLDAYAGLLAGRMPRPKPRTAWERIQARVRHITDVDVDWEPGIAADVVASSRAYEELAATKDDRASDDPGSLIVVMSTPDGKPFVGREAFLPFAGLVGFAWRDDARQALARISLAAAEHRATHGDFPASLDELKSMFPDGVPLDPFTDAPFVYERTATGVRIASVGRLQEEDPLDEATLRERCLVWELKR